MRDYADTGRCRGLPWVGWPACRGRESDAGLVALGWRGLWLGFLASAVPTILFTVTGVLGLRQAGLSPSWVSALGWLSAAAHLLALFTLAQRGAFAPDGIIAALVPLTTVIWMLAQAATLPRFMASSHRGQLNRRPGIRTRAGLTAEIRARRRSQSVRRHARLDGRACNETYGDRMRAPAVDVIAAQRRQRLMLLIGGLGRAVPACSQARMRSRFCFHGAHGLPRAPSWQRGHIWLVTESVAGRVWLAIRDSELRTEVLGLTAFPVQAHVVRHHVADRGGRGMV